MNVFEVLIAKSNEHLWKWNVKDKWIWKAEKRGRKCQNCVWKEIGGLLHLEDLVYQKNCPYNFNVLVKMSKQHWQEGGRREGGVDAGVAVAQPTVSRRRVAQPLTLGGAHKQTTHLPA